MKVIQVMFIGERADWRGKISKQFIDRDGETYSYSGVKNVWFGDVYEMSKDADGNATMAMRPKAIESDWKPTAAQETEYEAHKIAVKNARERKRKELEVKKPHKNITQAVELLRPFYRGLDMHSRARFTDWIANQCSKPVKRK